MSTRRLAPAVLIACACALSTSLPAQSRRVLTVDDLFALKTVGDPRISPDGRWVAYTVSQMDAETDTSDTDIWRAPLGGGPAVRLTTSDRPESRPRWSPDGRYLGFLSGRDGEKTQVWLLPTGGGEAVRLTDFPGGVSDFEWSPDGSRLAVVASDADPDESGRAKPGESARAPKPIVVTRLQFKRDGVGYLTDRRDHVYVVDVATTRSVQVTSGPYDDRSPVWSPDGRTIAFVSNRTKDPDANNNTDIFVVAAEAGATPRALTAWPGEDDSPVFTPDGQAIVYVQGGDPQDVWYDTNDLATVSLAGGPPRLLAPDLDRNVSNPRVSPDGRVVFVGLEDRGNEHLARVPTAGGAVERVVAGDRDVLAFDVGPRGELVVLESQPHYPPEVFAVRDGGLTRVTHVNDELLAGIRLASVERFQAKGRDGAVIDWFLTRPPDIPAGTRVPTLLRIHGGPVSQFSARFNFEWQLFAAHGYAVVAANPRGSSGRGRAFSRAIFADWGTKDFEDVMAAVDHAVALGVADPDRLGVGGWSYGGILTNYVITKTTRFKAAISGASEVNYTANYGHDHYQRQWEAELGLPWRNVDLWIKLSPFFQVERVTTPTLVMCGQQDWNVPLQNSEQLYQALRRLGRETQLVIYPGQSHSIRRPSYQKDRYERYLAWYDRYLKPRPTTP